jgi:beta-glucanase (GH16 family)
MREMSTGACQKSSRDRVSFCGLQVHDGVPFTAWIAALILIGSLFLLAEVPASARARWELVWSDEFNGSPNSPPDPLKWTHDLGTHNEELDNDTNLPENAHLDGKGHLIIHVESTPAGYTSARIKTEGLFTSLYGRIEARIKLPSGQGIWPTFWMLGADFDAVGWPKCGEIDIMENIGKEPSVNHGSLHGPGYSGSSAMTAAYTLPNGKKLSNDFHTFGIQWAPEAVSFYVDGNLYEILTSSSVPPDGEWVFNHPFFLVLDVAVGGKFSGYPDKTTTFPQDMIVDYVRVYRAPRSPIALLRGLLRTALVSLGHSGSPL